MRIKEREKEGRKEGLKENGSKEGVKKVGRGEETERKTGIERRPNLKEWKHNSEGVWARKAGSANSRNRFRHVADHPGTVLINK